MNKKSPKQSAATKSRTVTKRSGRAPQNSKRGAVTKHSLLLKALNRPRGTSIEVLCRDMNWQAHSVRAALSKLRKSGLEIVYTKSKSGASIYRSVANSSDAAHMSEAVERSS